MARSHDALGVTLAALDSVVYEDGVRPSEQNLAYAILKRLIDVAVSAGGLILLSPVLLPLALAIKLHSPGPIIFRQTRIGKEGKPFTMLKFRSMRDKVDATIHRNHVASLIMNPTLAPANGTSAKLSADPRVTGLGRILRKTSLDELPQLINVLRGEMSLIGPRPPLPYEVELYEDWHRQRLEVLPGITGWWQVKGRNQVSFDEMVEMDIFYIDQMSFWLDLKILALTPLAMFNGKGAG